LVIYHTSCSQVIALNHSYHHSHRRNCFHEFRSSIYAFCA